MKVMVNCRGLFLHKATGVENFAISVIESLADFVEEVIVDANNKREVQFCKDYFKEYKNITCVCDPMQDLLMFSYRRWLPFRVAVKLLLKTLSLLGICAPTGWAKKQKADVVFYPFHRSKLEYKHIPVVTTVHAILPEYTERDMAIILKHMRLARAIVTSWPHPFKDLSDRYPFIKGRLFLVPFTTLQNVAISKDYDISKLGIKEHFYLYPALIIPRKNHANLIKAYGILKKQGKQPPVVVCTGVEPDKKLMRYLMNLANTLGVADRFLFLGYVSCETMAALYHQCFAAISSSYWEAGIAAIQEGGTCGKPVICSDIEPARDHAKLFNMDVCFFDPNEPEDIAKKLIYFQDNIKHYRDSSMKAQPAVHLVDKKYMGKCYSDILRHAAGQALKPEWAPFLSPRSICRTNVS